MSSNKINILMVIASPGIGGAEMFALNIVRYIDHAKFHVDFAINFFVKNGSIEDECKRYGCKFYQLPYFRIYNYHQYTKAWNDFFNSHSYDIVHAHSTNSASIFLNIAKKHGVKTIAHSHSAGYRGNFFERKVKQYFTRKVGAVADYWFACSDLAANRLFDAAYKTYPHYYNIPNAINTDNYIFNCASRNKIRKKYNISNSTFVCGHVGSFTSPKNHLFLVDIFGEILKTRPDSKLLSCGAGNTLQSVKEHANELGILDNIIFAGIVNNVSEYLMAMDMFIFPSIFEGFPISILEAESTGLPIIMSDIITNEVDLTNLVIRCSLNDDPSIWANIALSVTSSNREDYNQYIAQTKYNINLSAKHFEKLYVQLLND